MEENILNNIDMTQGVTPEGAQVNNAPMADLTDIIKTRFQNGEPALDILVDLIMQGIEPNQMGMAFEEIGFDPASYTQLLQDAEIKLQGMQQQAQAQQQMQQQQMPEQGNQQLPPVSEEELLAESEKAAREIESKDIQPMQYGGGTNRGLGPFLGSKDPVPRPLYLPPLPAQGNILGAAYMLDDAAGQLFSNKDRDGDGLMDGTFKDWSAKRARYKDKQLQNRTYEIDYGDLNPDDYSPTYQNLADLTETKFSKFFKGKKERERINQVQNTGLQTKEEFAENVFKNSLINFNPETGQYAAAFATRPEDYAMLGKKQKEEFGLLGPKKERKWSDPSSWFGREDAPLEERNTLERFTENLSNQDDIDLQMIKEARKYGPGRGLNKNRSSYDESLMTPSQIEQSRNTYRDIMLGEQSMNSEQPFINFNQTQGFNATPKRSIVQIPEDQSSSNSLDRETAFKQWALQDPVTRMTTAGRKEFDRLNPMRYGGGLRKAQYGMNDYDPNNPYGLPDFSQMGQTSYINPDTGMPYEPFMPNPIQLNEIEGLQSKGLEPFVVDTPQMDLSPMSVPSQSAVNLTSKSLNQVPTAQPDLNLAPIDFPEATKIEGLKSKALTEIPTEMPEMKLAPVDLTPPTQPSADENVERPTVKRKRTIGNAIKQAETFIKEDPAMRAYGDVSDFVVKGANLANEIFQQREFNDYKNKLRNLTNADKVYLASEDPVNKRGTFDVNLGLAEPDNLVDYYAQAMYGREMYKKGGEFEPHMMYDPETGKGYKAKVPADHERMAKMGYLHKDEMQDGGERDYAAELKDAYKNDILLKYLEHNIDQSLGAMNYDLPYTPEQQLILDEVNKAQEDLYRYEDSVMRKRNYDKSRYTDEDKAELERLKEIWDTKRNSDEYKSLESAMEFRDVNSDPLRHSYSSALTTQKIADKAAAYIPFSDYLPHDEIIGLISANILGAGHEAAVFDKGERPFMTKLKESGMDMYNNFLGSVIGATTNTPEEAAVLAEELVKRGYTSSGRIEDKQEGGELEVDNDTLAALIAAGADIEML
jgi:hypothetical protein